MLDRGIIRITNMNKKTVVIFIVGFALGAGSVWYFSATSSPTPADQPADYSGTMTKAEIIAKSRSIVIPKAFPNSGNLGGAAFEWNIADTEGSLATHSAVHWGGPSDPREFGLDVGPSDAGYTEFTKEFASGAFSLPRDFATNIEFPEYGLYHYRFHAIVGGLNFWSEEHIIEISE